MDACLVLEDGRVFHGKTFGARRDAVGEVVFNTAMTGYQEILTDPSYAGQIVVMTFPLIGNYGVTPEDAESRRVWPEGFVVREYSDLFSNWRGRQDLTHYLREHSVAGITGVDTRALTRHIRSAGAMRGVISTLAGSPAALAGSPAALAGSPPAATGDLERLVARVLDSPSMQGRDLVHRVTIEKPYTWEERTPSAFGVLDEVVPADEPPLPGGSFQVAVLDYGVKQNILRRLVDVGGRVTVWPAGTSAAEILAARPDGVVFSNGPGDPAALPAIAKEARALAEAVPSFGICLGHQILGQAFGYSTYKLKYGHHGANHPVKHLEKDRVDITSQNHGFAVDMKSGGDGLVETHVNLNDHTTEGFRHAELPVFGIQFHPEASPGPRDAAYLFREFVRAMGERRERAQREA
jgi:carbamoyl-phosphate synthase small subunit